MGSFIRIFVVFSCLSANLASGVSGFKGKNYVVKQPTGDYVDKMLLKIDAKYNYEIQNLKRTILDLSNDFAERITELHEELNLTKSSCLKDHVLPSQNTESRRATKSIEDMDIPGSESFPRTPIRKKRQTISAVATPHDKRVAFSTTLSRTLSNLGAMQDIRFDQVNLNIANGYNSNHGLFVAPSSGVYVISVTLHRGMTKSYANLMVNANAVAKLDLMSDNISHQVSQTIVVHLKAGDDVSVETIFNGGGLFGDKYSSFSGFLLYEDMEAITIG